MKLCRNKLHEYEPTELYRGQCPECKRNTSRKWVQKNKEKHLALVLDWRKRHPEKVSLANKKHGSRWRKRNPEKCGQYNAKWKKGNPEKWAAIAARYRAAKLHRTPNWLTEKHKQEILNFYRRAHELSLRGIKMSVDHVIPLQGKFVSGLHVPWNLQIIKFSENARKSNRV